MILKIVKYGSSILRTKCSDIVDFNPSLSELIDNMYETLDESKGVGLSANQVGIPIRLFIVKHNNFNEVFINPKIIEKSDDETISNESCLSFPGITCEIKRPEKIKIDYLSADFVNRVSEYSGEISRIIQHEYEHIEGKVFIDNLSPIVRKLLNGKIQKIIKKG